MLPLDEILKTNGQYYIQAKSAPPPELTRVLKQDNTFGVFDEYGDVDAEERPQEGIFSRRHAFSVLSEAEIPAGPSAAAQLHHPAR